MLSHLLSATLALFSRTFIIKGSANNGRNPPSCPFPVVAFDNKKAIDTINEGTIGTIIAPRNPLSCFVIPCFTVSVVPSMKKLRFSSDSTSLIISYLSLF